MKNELIIDGVEYIKKSKYDLLNKKKVRIINDKISFDKILITNPENTIGIFPLKLLDNQKDFNKIKVSEYKEVSIFESTMLDSTEENEDNGFFNPRIKIKENIYSHDLIEEAKRIIRSIGYEEDDFKLYIHKSKKQQPLLIKFFEVGVFIAPRVDSDLERLNTTEETSQ